MMQSDLAFFLVAVIVLILLVVVSRWLCRGGKAAAAATKPPRAKRDPKEPLKNNFPFSSKPTITERPECLQ